MATDGMTDSMAVTPAPITLTPEQQARQPLLQQYGIILAPDEIDHDGYVMISWSLHLGRLIHHCNRPLQLRISGDGGATRPVLAMADLIQADGNIWGVALGGIISSHATLWAACARRYAYPNVFMGIHPITRTFDGRLLDATSFRRYAEEHDLIDAKIASLYARASNKDLGWWQHEQNSAGAALRIFTFEELVILEMARPASELWRDFATEMTRDTLQGLVRARERDGGN